MQSVSQLPGHSNPLAWPTSSHMTPMIMKSRNILILACPLSGKPAQFQVRCEESQGTEDKGEPETTSNPEPHRCEDVTLRPRHLSQVEPQYKTHLERVQHRALAKLGLISMQHGTRLQILQLEDCHYKKGVRAHLAAATHLQHLLLGVGSEKFDRGFGLSAADAGVLSALPALSSLHVQTPGHMRQHAWNSFVAQLKGAFLAQGYTPPVITGW